MTCALCGYGLPARNTGLCDTCAVRTERWMRMGWERGITHPRTRKALVLALSQVPAPIDPFRWADQLLVEMAAGYEHLDGIACDTPQVETSLEPVTGDELTSLDVWMSQAMGARR